MQQTADTGSAIVELKYLEMHFALRFLRSRKIIIMVIGQFIILVPCCLLS